MAGPQSGASLGVIPMGSAPPAEGEGGNRSTGRVSRKALGFANGISFDTQLTITPPAMLYRVCPHPKAEDRTGTPLNGVGARSGKKGAGSFGSTPVGSLRIHPAPLGWSSSNGPM